ncbi:MAG TPA: ribose 5-phosphate isomerase B [Candidatus Eisenbacteria bacterium]|nr:ribose 5-phosphate isomerase B [Candidatus Eisenbacteria bacterium]
MREVNESEVRRLVREAVDRALGPVPASRSAVPAKASTTAKPTPPAAPRPAAVRGKGAASARRVAIGSDHGGYALKEVLRRAIVEDSGWEVSDCGTHSAEAVDYPDFAAAVGREVASGRCTLGVIVDAAGIGSAIAANKVPGVRCAVCHDDATVINSREHNDANVLSLGARVVHRGAATRMVRLFLSTAFAGGRHERRVQKIMALEQRGH